MTDDADRQKRVDLRLGGFACSVRGFDDPAAVLDEVLRRAAGWLAEDGAIARLPALPQGPALAALARELAEAAGLPDEEVTAVPGLIVIREDPETESAEPPPDPADPAPALETELSEVGQPEPHIDERSSAGSRMPPEAEGHRTEYLPGHRMTAAPAPKDAETTRPLPNADSDAGRFRPPPEAKEHWTAFLPGRQTQPGDDGGQPREGRAPVPAIPSGEPAGPDRREALPADTHQDDSVERLAHQDAVDEVVDDGFAPAADESRTAPKTRAPDTSPVGIAPMRNLFAPPPPAEKPREDEAASGGRRSGMPLPSLFAPPGQEA